MASILVVDDDVVIFKVVQATLLRAGHTAVLAKDGYEALDLLKKELFELIVSDANMPQGLSGFNLVATIRKDNNFKQMLEKY